MAKIVGKVPGYWIIRIEKNSFIVKFCVNKSSLGRGDSKVHPDNLSIYKEEVQSTLEAQYSRWWNGVV